MTLPSARAIDGRLLCLLLVGGLALRLLWQWQVFGHLTGFIGAGEAARVAVAVAKGHGLADAYFAGSGPTAHVMPLSPLLAGGVMAASGIGSAAANIALLALSLGQVAVAYWLVARLFGRLGLAAPAIRWALILLAFVPLYIEREVIDFRYWEGALVLGLAAATLTLLVDVIDRKRLSWRTMVGAAALCALTTFTSPPAGLAVSACWGLWALHRLPLVDSLRFALIGAVALGAIVTPWAIRNQHALGAPVLLRSNGGLELALANHPAALAELPPSHVFDQRMDEIHPYRPGPGRAAMTAAGGEAAYSARLGASARAWIAAHPTDFVRLSLRHLRQLYFPQPWQFAFTESDGRSVARALAMGLVNLIGLASLVIGLVMRRRGYAMLALYLGVLTLPYILVQPTPRYTFPLYTVLLFVAIDGLVRLGVRRRARRAPDMPADGLRAGPA